MQIIVVTAKTLISMRILSVESQASFLHYVRGGCRHSASALAVKSALCDDRHKMIIDRSHRKPLVLRTVVPVHVDNFWIMRNLQSEFGHAGRLVSIELGCTCTREITLVARANGED